MTGSPVPPTAGQTGQRGPVAGLGVGILMLDTHFMRPPGDIGNAFTWSVPVQFAILKGVSEARAVERADEALLPIIIEAATSLIELGVKGITTSCGFLAPYQQQLREALSVPVAVSSLLQARLAQTVLPAGRKVGILTFSAENLSPRHLDAAGVPADSPVEGMPKDSMFRQVYGGEDRAPDPCVLEREMIDAARRLVTRHPEVGAIVCECTNMPPYSAAINAATGVPVHDIVGFVDWFARSLMPPSYRQPTDAYR